MNRPSFLAVALCLVPLAACGTASTIDRGPEEPSVVAPVYAHTVDGDEDNETKTVMVSGSERTTVVGTPWGFLPNGSLLLDRYPVGGEGDGKPSFIFDPKSGKSYPGTTVSAVAYEARGVGPQSLFAVRPGAARKLMLQEFDFHFVKKREVALPGLNSSGFDDQSAGTFYREAVASDEAVFLTRSEVTGVDTTSDMVTRVDKDGTVSNILKDRHISGLILGSDGQSILASEDKQAPFYEGRPATKSIVELDPRTGLIAKSYGVPPPCKTYVAQIDDESCLARIDKLGGVVAVSVYESSRREGDRLDGYSTWAYRDGSWVEEASQRDKTVVWQSRNDRIEQPFRLNFTSDEGEAPIEWVAGSTRHVLDDKGFETIRDWAVQGSLIRP